MTDIVTVTDVLFLHFMYFFSQRALSEGLYAHHVLLFIQHTSSPKLLDELLLTLVLVFVIELSQDIIFVACLLGNATRNFVGFEFE